ncbi:hypothetical protein ES703_54178 [subsurface metagenome]
MFFRKHRGHRFVDRGDPAAADFNKDTLTFGMQYIDLDLSGILPKSARLVMLRLKVEISAGAPACIVRSKDNTHSANKDVLQPYVLDTCYYKNLWVACGSDGIIQCLFMIATYTICDLTVGGWFE